MSSSEAQKSPVHAATEDSSAEPTGPMVQPPGTAQGSPQAGRAGASAAAGNAVSRDAADLKSRPDTTLGVPGNFERGAAMAGRHPDTDADANPPGATNVIGGGPGAGDASSGGGAGAGIPGGGTDMRTDGAIRPGNPDEDRKRLFPDAPGNAAGGPRADDTTVRNDLDPDESSFGGPLNLDDPNAV